MPQIVDARGNEFIGSLDQIGGGTVTDARTSSATLSSLNAELLMDLNGQAVATFDLRAAALSATLVFEGTLDGTNYIGLPAYTIVATTGQVVPAETFVASIVTATTLNGQYLLGVSGFRRVRVRISAYTSGSVVAFARASRADYAIQSRPIPSNLHVTVTAAAASGATISLPTGGPGLFHYITNIHIQRNATAALAGTATLVITSTNLPGTPAWSVGNAMIAGGTQLDLNYTPTTPLKSLVANTATTIVMPAPGAAVLWRGNCTYYIGA
jgi:hypothetical protein